MADLFFSRDTKVYLEQGTNIWEIPILDGFSFSQSINSSEVTLNEMVDASGNSRRAKKVFNDSLAPAEWSFSCYARPFIGAADGDWDGTTPNHHCIEEAVLANFVAANDFTPGSGGTAPAWDAGVTYNAGDVTFDFDDSNKPALGTFNLYFVFGGSTAQVYKVTNCVTNTLTMNFEIDGISTLEVSGMGATVSDEGSTEPTVTIAEDLTATDNFIRNRLTSLAIVAGDDLAQGTGSGGAWTTFPGAGNGVYSIAITGGSITFENNITFLTPETLGIVNQPIEHVTGTRSVSGSFTAYLAAGTAGDAADFFNDLVDANTVITNVFDLTFSVGGGDVPRVEFDLPQCHIEVPAHSIEDVISIETSFSGLASTMDSTDEATIKYIGAP